jgi:hypothetical protein
MSNNNQVIGRSPYAHRSRSRDWSRVCLTNAVHTVTGSSVLVTGGARVICESACRWERNLQHILAAEKTLTTAQRG